MFLSFFSFVLSRIGKTTCQVPTKRYIITIYMLIRRKDDKTNAQTKQTCR